MTATRFKAILGGLRDAQLFMYKTKYVSEDLVRLKPLLPEDGFHLDTVRSQRRFQAALSVHSGAAELSRAKTSCSQSVWLYKSSDKVTWALPSLIRGLA